MTTFADAPSANHRASPAKVVHHAVELTIPWEEKGLAPEQVVTMLVNHAAQLRVSDLFLSCNEHDVTASVRHLGIVERMAVFPVDLGLRCIAHIRAMARLKFGEKRHPQDGRWVVRLGDGSHLDLRLNTIPTLYGESLAMRLLDRDSHLRQIDSLGFVGPQLATLKSMLHANSGLFLITGSTGCGKTTTLYACLHHLNNGHRKIHTIEDPIEYSVPGLHQTQVEATSTSGGADFAEMLRGVMRQGPDVIMIGEVRDQMTADTAVRAANSGQLMFATLHSATAAGAVQSLLSLGVSPYFLCTSMLAVIGQRLMRTLSTKSRRPLEVAPQPSVFDEVRPWLESPEAVTPFAAGEGPDGGYDGRTGVFEILALSPALRGMVLATRPARELHQKALEEGMVDFRRAALLKIAQGLTTFEEMQRILPAGEGVS